MSIARWNLKGPEEKYRAVVNGDTQRRTGQPMVGKVEPVLRRRRRSHSPTLHQGVCGQHGTEEQRVTSGELAEFPGGTGISGPISVKRNGERRSVSSRTAAYYLGSVVKTT